MSRQKTLLELVREGTFRRGRHGSIVRHDTTVLYALQNFHLGLLDLDEAEFHRLDWVYWWQAQLVTGKCHEVVFWANFAAVIAGSHPASPAPWPEEIEP